MDESLYLRIRELNPHIVCILCAGYFIDATTITECLHTFCKSCIVKYLQTSKHCPICNTKVHETQPLLNLKADRTLQDIVFKLVPSLWENEMKRRQEFEKSRNLAESNKEELEGSQSNIEEETGMANRHLYIHDELIHIRIEPVRNGPSTQALMMQGRLRYVRCSVRAQIYHLKKLIQKLWPMAAGKEVGIMCNGKIIPETHCLKRMWLSNVKDQVCIFDMAKVWSLVSSHHG